MPIIIVEFKAVCTDTAAKESILLQYHPRFAGEDHQIDTYFNVSSGRLKLREGIIENALIQYERNNELNSKKSSVLLYKHAPDKSLKEILIHSLGIKAIVDKKRKIYFIDNVKFHFDTVNELGSFIEVEAIDEDGTIGEAKLTEQCNFYKSLFDIQQNDLIAVSYSDLIIEKK